MLTQLCRLDPMTIRSKGYIGLFHGEAHGPSHKGFVNNSQSTHQVARRFSHQGPCVIEKKERKRLKEKRVSTQISYPIPFSLSALLSLSLCPFLSLLSRHLNTLQQNKTTMMDQIGWLTRRWCMNTRQYSYTKPKIPRKSLKHQHISIKPKPGYYPKSSFNSTKKTQIL